MYNIYVYIFTYNICSSSVKNAVTQLFEALRYKPGGCGFNSPSGYWNFSLRLSFWPHYGRGVD
jgi:hypothetical protein